MGWLDSVQISSLNKSIDGLWLREKAISNNIANYETPNYKRHSVSFEEQLQSQLDKSGNSKQQTIRNIQQVNPMINTSYDQALRTDGNNVDIEYENIEMARTQINYSYSVSQLNECFVRLRAAINGGR